MIVKRGDDNNTLLDNCDNEMADSSTAYFTTYSQIPTPLDSMYPVACRIKNLQFAFNKNIKCSSIDSLGSDFYITGSYPVQVVKAEGKCANGITKIIKVQLRNRLEAEGTFTIHLQRGSDGNTIVDECGTETPENSSIEFYVKDTVSAAYKYTLTQNCDNDHIDFVHNGGNSIYSWNWLIDNNLVSTHQSPSFTFNTFGSKRVELNVTNGFCSDTVIQDIVFPYDSLIAAFSVPALYCPDESISFTDASRGNIVAWNWSFANGATSTMQNPPPQTFYTPRQEQFFPIRLIVRSSLDCYDTTYQNLRVAHNCHIAVPSAFTPNGDGTNDYLYPLNAYKSTDLWFVIYNKWGQKIYETTDWTKKWDGTVNGHKQPSDMYVWILRYKDETGKQVFLKGTSMLMR